MRLRRTESGYRAGTVEVDSQELTPRTAQLALLTAGLGHSIREASHYLGLTTASGYKTAERLYWKLNVNNLPQAITELYKRGIIRHLCAALFICITAAPQADADPLLRRPPARYRQARCRRQNKLNQLLQPQ